MVQRTSVPAGAPVPHGVRSPVSKAIQKVTVRCPHCSAEQQEPGNGEIHVLPEVQPVFRHHAVRHVEVVIGSRRRVIGRLQMHRRRGSSFATPAFREPARASHGSRRPDRGSGGRDARDAGRVPQQQAEDASRRIVSSAPRGTRSAVRRSPRPARRAGRISTSRTTRSAGVSAATSGHAARCTSVRRVT